MLHTFSFSTYINFIINSKLRHYVLIKSKFYFQNYNINRQLNKE